MNINPIQVKFPVNPNFTSRRHVNFSDNPYNSEKPKEEKLIPQSKVIKHMFICGLGTAAMTAFLLRKNFGRSNSYLDEANRALQKQVSSLTKDCEDLKVKNKTLEQLANDAKSKFEEIFEGDISPKEQREKVYEKLKAKIADADYGYDITNPPITGKSVPSESKSYDIIMPDAVGTTNRMGMKELEIPEINYGEFSLEIPMSNEVKITHESKKFNPVQNKESTVALAYGKAVKWSSDKVARDIMQNFYDGHGQTLDGVKLNFSPLKNGKYKVKIEGKSTYSPDKAIYLGLSSKQFNSKAAGNYGEGLKMASLKLLTEGGASDVKIASDNWKCTWTIGKSELMPEDGEKVMYYSVDKLSEKLDGNYLEFETTDKNLLESLRKSINRFYHSGNRDFECPQFENELAGIKILPSENARGGIYVAGQRFEFDNDFDGLKGVCIFTKEKLPSDIIDVSRDRISFDSDKLKKVAEWLSNNEKTTKEDKVNIIKTLEKYWDAKGFRSQTPMDEFLETFIRNESYSYEPLKIKFPDKCVAYSMATPEVVADLKSKGYRVCKAQFSRLGMPTIHDLLGDARAHDIVVPNDIEKKKILIIKEALQKLSPILKGKHFSPSELDTKIFLFDKNSLKERNLYSDTQAEAIIDFGTSKGFWIDKGYLNKSSFTDILETALHELSHKAGGDGSANFSYKLTDVNRDAIDLMLNNAQTRTELNALSHIWNEL